MTVTNRITGPAHGHNPGKWLSTCRSRKIVVRSHWPYKESMPGHLTGHWLNFPLPVLWIAARCSYSTPGYYTASGRKQLCTVVFTCCFDRRTHARYQGRGRILSPTIAHIVTDQSDPLLEWRPPMPADYPVTTPQTTDTDGSHQADLRTVREYGQQQRVTDNSIADTPVGDALIKRPLSRPS